jgi:hypothetical protein
MRSSKLIKLCLTLSISALAVHQHTSSCNAQGCSSAAVSTSMGDVAPHAGLAEPGCGCDSGPVSQCDCCCGSGAPCGCGSQQGLFSGRLRSNLMGRVRGQDCGCDGGCGGCDGGSCDGSCSNALGGPSLRSRLFLDNPIPRGPATGIGLTSRGSHCNGNSDGCEGCQGGLFSNLGTGRLTNGLAGRVGNVGSRLRGMTAGGFGSDSCNDCGSGNGLANGGLASKFGGAGNGAFGSRMVSVGSGAMDLLGNDCVDCGSGFGRGALASRIGGTGDRLGCGYLGGCGGVGCGGCHACSGLLKGIVGPARGEIPHTSQPPYGSGMDQQAPTYAYPYYTARAPRDFLMDNPPSIGW